jgi:L-2,4-diaminobutyric acid acetyltransferase
MTLMNVTLRSPSLEDGAAISQLVNQSQTLDVNSSYLYFLLASHFSQTCAVAECEGELVGFVTAYRLPQQPNCLFVWQIAVSPLCRGQGLASQLLAFLASRPWFGEIEQVQCTISPHNRASNRLFEKFAATLGAKRRVRPFLSQAHLGEGHDPEPLVCLDLPSSRA